MPGRQLIMTFPVTATSHSLADYRARGGYEALRKALAMAPQDVTKEVTASGLLGHGGAAFPVGRKWAVVKLDDRQAHYLCANADEGEPGTFKDRWILEHAPHLLVESMLITSYALQVRHAFVYIRGEFDLPYRRLAGAIEEAYATARRITDGAPLVARWHKKFIRRLLDPRPLTSEERDEGYACFDTEDFKIGVAAFLAKKKPDFTGR